MHIQFSSVSSGLVFFAALLVVAFIWWQFEKRRRSAWSRWARTNGFAYSAGENRAVASEFQFLRRLDEGTERVAKDVVRGKLGASEVTGFNYSSKRAAVTVANPTGPDSSYRRERNIGVLALRLDRPCPELRIRRERVWHKVASTVLGNDLDVGSTRFRKRFVLNGNDPVFAQAFCNANMERLLLSSTDLGIEVEVDGYWMALIVRGKLQLDELSMLWGFLQEAAELLPETLIDEQRESVSSW